MRGKAPAKARNHAVAQPCALLQSLAPGLNGLTNTPCSSPTAGRQPFSGCTKGRTRPIWSGSRTPCSVCFPGWREDRPLPANPAHILRVPDPVRRVRCTSCASGARNVRCFTIACSVNCDPVRTNSALFAALRALSVACPGACAAARQSATGILTKWRRCAASGRP